jgi:hypothetical protein
MLFRLILLIHFGNSVEAWLHNIHEAPRYNRGRIPRSSGRPNRPRGGPMANPPRIVSSSAGVAMDASENLDLDDDSEARSAFGTKEYWDETHMPVGGTFRPMNTRGTTAGKLWENMSRNTFRKSRTFCYRALVTILSW